MCVCVCVCFCVHVHTLPPGDHLRHLHATRMFVLPVTPSIGERRSQVPPRAAPRTHPTCLQRKVPGCPGWSCVPSRTHPQLLRTHGCIPCLQGLAALLLFSEEETPIPNPPSVDTLPACSWPQEQLAPHLGLRLGCDPPLSPERTQLPLSSVRPSSLPHIRSPHSPPHSPLHRKHHPRHCLLAPASGDGGWGTTAHCAEQLGPMLTGKQA